MGDSLRHKYKSLILIQNQIRVFLHIKIFSNDRRTNLDLRGVLLPTESSYFLCCRPLSKLSSMQYTSLTHYRVLNKRTGSQSWSRLFTIMSLSMQVISFASLKSCKITSVVILLKPPHSLHVDQPAQVGTSTFTSVVDR